MVTVEFYFSILCFVLKSSILRLGSELGQICFELFSALS